MTRKQICLFGLLLLLALAPCTFGQATEKTIAAINARYSDIAEKARLCETDDDQGEFGALVMNTLDINARSHQWRAVGIYRPVYKFFYKQVENDEKRLYPDQLVLVKTPRRVSSRVYYEEFLFSDTGELMLYVQKAENDETVPAERRVYFSGVKALRFTDDSKTRDKLTRADIKTADNIRWAARKLVDVFKRSIDL